MLEYEQLVIAAKANSIVNKMPEKITRDPTTRYQVRAENNIIFAIKRKII